MLINKFNTSVDHRSGVLVLSMVNYTNMFFSVHRRKYTQRLQEQEEHIETLVIKVNNLEKQKSRLQSEVEVLIIDLEKANNTARELQKRVEHYERVNIELKSRLDETLQVNTANELLLSCQIINSSWSN